MPEESAKQSRDEMLGHRISSEEKMRFIKRVNAVFDKGAAQEDLNLLRILHAGILHTDMLSPEKSEYSFGNTGGTIVVSGNGATVEVGSDGTVITKPGPANDTAAKGKTAPEIGDLDDGGIYVGLSAENGKPLHAALADLPEYKTYEEAVDAAKQLKVAHPTAHVPMPKELDKNLFDNRNTGHLKGTFNTSGSFPASVYRTSAPYYHTSAQVQYFDDGYQDYNVTRSRRFPVRLVW